MREPIEVRTYQTRPLTTDLAFEVGYETGLRSMVSFATRIIDEMQAEAAAAIRYVTDHEKRDELEYKHTSLVTRCRERLLSFHENAVDKIRRA